MHTTEVVLVVAKELILLLFCSLARRVDSLGLWHFYDMDFVLSALGCQLINNVSLEFFVVDYENDAAVEVCDGLHQRVGPLPFIRSKTINNGAWSEHFREHRPNHFWDLLHLVLSLRFFLILSYGTLNLVKLEIMHELRKVIFLLKAHRRCQLIHLLVEKLVGDGLRVAMEVVDWVFGQVVWR